MHAAVLDFQLLLPTPMAWLDVVLEDFNTFLLDHAACERKASAMAMSMLLHYPDRTELVKAMADLALEELQHFRQVLKLLLQRGLSSGADSKDPYVAALRKQMRTKSETYLLDRLLVASIIEARGAERFQLIAEHHPDPDMQNFYQRISQSEARHYQLFLDLAQRYFPCDEIEPRVQELLQSEAQIVQRLMLRAALH